MPKRDSRSKVGNTTRLSFDILWNVVRIVSAEENPDFQVLCALGGTSQALRREAQKRIYRELLIYNPPEFGCHGPEPFQPRPYADEFRVNWEDLRDIVETCPWITDYVRSVRLRWDYDIAGLDEDAIELISSFKNVERLTIGRHETYFPMNWKYSVDKHILDGWKTLLKLPCITSLRLACIENIPPHVLLLCKRLTSLTLDCGSSFSRDEPKSLGKRTIKLERLRCTTGAREIMALFTPRGPDNQRLIDVHALTHLDMSLSFWESSFSKIMDDAINLTDLRIDTWHKSNEHHTPELVNMLDDAELPLKNKLRRLTLRYRLNRYLRDRLSPGHLISEGFPPESPELQVLDITIILEDSKPYDWFLKDVAELEKCFLPESQTSFPKLTTLKLTVTVLDKSAGVGRWKPLTSKGIIARMPRAAARPHFLDVSVDFAESAREISADNDPSSDEGEGEYCD